MEGIVDHLDNMQMADTVSGCLQVCVAHTLIYMAFVC
jgi:hypothetical protein